MTSVLSPVPGSSGNDPWTLTGKTILVTGASSGIGQVTAIELAQRGARVVLSGRDQLRLDSTRARMVGNDHGIEVFDLAQLDQLDPWMSKIAAQHGRLDGLVHCAGIAALQLARMSTVKTWERLLKVNVIAAGQLVAAYRQPDVAASTGSIVFISSVTGLVGDRGLSAYSATKGAIIALTRSLALEFAADGLRVNCVAPGQVRTPMADQTHRFMTPEQIAALESRHPLGFGEPEDVARAIAFLMMPSAKWITGTTLVVDGGFTAQ